MTRSFTPASQTSTHHSRRLSHLRHISIGRQKPVPSINTGLPQSNLNSGGQLKLNFETAGFSPQLNPSTALTFVSPFPPKSMAPKSLGTSFAMNSTAPSSPTISGESRASQAVSILSHSDYDALFGRKDARVDHVPASGKEKGLRWLGHVKDWLSVSEPSAQAMKAQKRNVYQKHGIDLKDPTAAAKLHFPMGELPAGATTSTKGPTPEKALKKRAKERQLEPSYMGYTHTAHAHSISSGSSSTPSTKDVKMVAPWDS